MKNLFSLLFLLAWSSYALAKTTLPDLTNTPLPKIQGYMNNYCDSYGSVKSNIWISRVGIDTWENTSGNNKGHLLYPQNAFNFTSGTSYAWQLEPGGSIRVRDSLHWQVWIDKNLDRDFDDPGELVYRGKSVQRFAHKANFAIPTDVQSGDSRMRIVLSLNRFVSTACDTSTLVLETEDYPVNLRSTQVCAAPTEANLILKEVTNNTVTVKTKGLDVSAYEWEIRATDGSLKLGTPALTRDSIYFVGLKDNKDHEIRLRVVCKNGNYSAWSNPLAFSTLASCAEPDSNLLKADRITLNSAQLSWGIHPGAVYYRFYYRIKDTPTWTESAFIRTNTVPIGGLRPNTSYEYKIRVYCTENRNSFSPYSVTKTFRTLQETCPVSTANRIGVEVVGDTVMKFSYFPSSTYASILWRYRKSGAPNWTNLAAGVSSVKIPEPDVPYEISAQGTCASGIQTEWGTAKVFTPPCSAPKLKDMVITQVGYDEVKIAYRGAPRTGFFWQYKRFNETNWPPEFYLGDTLNKVNRLQPLTTYQFRLRSVCLATGLSNYSEPLTFTTIAFPCDTPHLASFKASSVTDNSAAISCDPVPGAVVYVFNYRKKGTKVWFKAHESPLSQGLFGGLEYNTVYEYTIQIGCQSGGNSVQLSPLQGTAEFKTLPRPCPVVQLNQVNVSYLGKRQMQVHCTLDAPAYAWRYREQYTLNWIDSTQSDSAKWIIKDLKFPASYEIETKVQCATGEWSAWKWSGKVFSTPRLDCAPPSSDLIALRIVRDSIYTFALFKHFYEEIFWRYRKSGTTEWITLSDSVVYKEGLHVKIGESIEVSIQGTCGSLGTSDWSEPLTLYGICQEVPLSDIHIKEVGAQSAELECSAKLYAGFYWLYRLHGEEDWTWVKTEGRTLVLEGLRRESTYEVQVQRICTEETGSGYSKTFSFSTSDRHCTPIDAEHPHASKITASSALISCNFSDRAKHYILAYRILGEQNWISTAPQANPEWKLDSLLSNTVYEYRIGIRCDLASAPTWSIVRNFTTLAPNFCPTPEVQHIRIIAKGDTIRFVYAGIYATNYHWRMRIAGETVWSNISDTDLEQGIVFDRAATYEIAVQLVCANDTSKWSKSKTLVWPCSAIDSNEITIREVNIQFASIHCTAPSVDGYRWRYREIGQSNWQKEIFTLPGDVLFEQLSAAKTYEFQVQRYCSDLVSTYSESQFFTTPPFPVVTDCGLSPAQLSIKELGAGRVELKHVPGPKQYFWAYRPYNQLNWQVQFTATSNMVTIDSLIPGQAYIFGTRISCGVGDTIDWVYLTYYPSCTSPVAADVHITAQGGNGAVLECNNYNFLTYQWRYRIDGSNDNWNYATGNRTELTQLAEQFYEVQVQGFCQQSGSWTPWSNSHLFRVGECKLPASLNFVPKFTQAGAVEVSLESKTTDWKANHFKWSYRENGRAMWTDNILTEDPVLSVSGLIPGQIYEFKVEATCIASSPSTLVHGEYIFLPKACFTPTVDRIKVERITQNSAYIYLDYGLYIPFDILYRVSGSQTDFETFPFVNDIPNFPYLTPGTEYEVVLRIKCNGDSTVQTAPVYFKTKNCEIPYAGAIAFDEIGLDFVEAHLESHNYHPPVDAVNYEWKYKLKSATTWEKALADTQDKLYLGALQPESDYDLKAVLHCPNAYADSIAFVASFKTTLDKCSSIESSKNAVIYPYVPEQEEYNISCSLPDDYYFSVRSWTRIKGVDNYYWEFSLSDSLQCAWVVVVPENAPDYTVYFQTRILCPSGNYSPWSDTIRLDFRKNQFNEMLAGKLVELESEETAKREKILLSPNPTQGQFKVVLPTVKSTAQNHLLEIFNLSGQKVYSKKLEGPEANIDLTGQAAGLYFLKANVGNQVITERILLQKH